MIVIIAVVAIVAILFYPILRKAYHHGIYDGIEEAMNKFVATFLKGLAHILDWCSLANKK